MERYGVTLVLLFSLLVLSPIISGKVQLPNLTAFIHWKMFLAIAVGVRLLHGLVDVV